MGVLDMFFRRRPIRETAELADFIDRNAAFLAQKGLYEYSRARAGHYAKVLFGEPGFREAVERSRWRAYPLALALVGELAEGVLRPFAAAERRRHAEAMKALVLAVFDRYPVPTVLGGETWRELRDGLAHRLELAALHAPKRAIDIPENYAKAYFDLMPIHEKLRTPDLPTTRNYLRVTLANIHDQLTRRIEGPALVKSLLEREVAAN